MRGFSMLRLSSERLRSLSAVAIEMTPLCPTSAFPTSSTSRMVFLHSIFASSIAPSSPIGFWFRLRARSPPPPPPSSDSTSAILVAPSAPNLLPSRLRYWMLLLFCGTARQSRGERGGQAGRDGRASQPRLTARQPACPPNSPLPNCHRALRLSPSHLEEVRNHPRRIVVQEVIREVQAPQERHVTKGLPKGKHLHELDALVE
mmetsp:Transcript_1771/g.6364  ORF Transcript_1771/g.6364 Transcript_1771/m.6364 type:complete len:203 (+) Transcript_1771:941-1549(+)